MRLQAEAEIILAEESVALERHEADVSFILRRLAEALHEVGTLWTVFTGNLEDLRRCSRWIQWSDGADAKSDIEPASLSDSWYQCPFALNMRTSGPATASRLKNFSHKRHKKHKTSERLFVLFMLLCGYASDRVC